MSQEKSKLLTFKKIYCLGNSDNILSIHNSKLSKSLIESITFPII